MKKQNFTIQSSPFTIYNSCFMDDWVVLALTRHKLRQAIKRVNRTLAELKVEKHPDKTFIGRIERGLDFLGYHFSPEGLSLAPQTIERSKRGWPRFTSKGRMRAALGYTRAAGGGLKMPG